MAIQPVSKNSEAVPMRMSACVRLMGQVHQIIRLAPVVLALVFPTPSAALVRHGETAKKQLTAQLERNFDTDFARQAVGLNDVQRRELALRLLNQNQQIFNRAFPTEAPTAMPTRC